LDGNTFCINPNIKTVNLFSPVSGTIPAGTSDCRQDPEKALFGDNPGQVYEKNGIKGEE